MYVGEDDSDGGYPPKQGKKRSNNSNTDNRTCYKCGKKGHMKRDCPLMKKQLEGGRGKGSDESAELLRLRLEDERLVWGNVSLKRKLKEAVGGSAQNEDKMYGLKTELEKLRLDLRKKDDEIEQMKLQVKGGRDAGADFDKVRVQFQSERPARKELAAQLRSSHEIQSSLRKSHAIREQRLKNELHEMRNLSSGSFPVEIEI